MQFVLYYSYIFNTVWELFLIFKRWLKWMPWLGFYLVSGTDNLQVLANVYCLFVLPQSFCDRKDVRKIKLIMQHRKSHNLSVSFVAWRCSQ